MRHESIGGTVTVLVLGATGFVGGALVPALVRAGERVRAASRRPPPRGAAESAGVEWIQCDVRVASTLPRAMEGVECVYYLVHSMGDANRREFRAIERRSASNVARAAAASGCRRIVYLGGVEPSGVPSEHLASRLEVGAILRGGEVPAIELRAAMIIGNGSASWRILRDLSLRLPLMLLPRWLESSSCPIALEDVVTALLDARRVPLDASRWYDIPGPEALRAREMLMLVGDLRGRRIPALRVPFLTPRLSAGWLKLVSGADYGVARELVLGLRGHLLPRDDVYWQLTGHPPTRSFREAARRALETEARGEGIGGWVAAGEERLVATLGRGS
ncbi:MAG: NAD(P)H-binding protein [Labilithrix sp.]|nr:NAD(P)H-binding protein [Labilithrix sp.]MBX3219091.1 NAD(P)H-binding protein [Labilithrix sp.]